MDSIDLNKDSGMESGIASSKDDTPERKTVSSSHSLMECQTTI